MCLLRHCMKSKDQIRIMQKGKYSKVGVNILEKVLMTRESTKQDETRKSSRFRWDRNRRKKL